MVRKAILTTGLFLLLYSLFIYVFRSHIQRTAQIVEQRNTVKAEEFLYENGHQADTIVVGSSMSNRLSFDKLPGHYYNLSLEGMGAIDGLRLLAQANSYPRLLLIEMNTLDHEPDTTFSARFSAVGWSQLHDYVPFTRLKYQPVGVVKALLRDWHRKIEVEQAEPIDTAFVTKLLQDRLTHTNDMPDEPLLHHRLGFASTYIRKLLGKGTQVVFFEMPTDSRVRKAKANARLRELVCSTFPAPAFQHIRFPSEIYQTTDGVHLPLNEGARYSQYIYQQLKVSPSSTSLAQVKASSMN
ncbi:hypothetical protein GO730_22300 [Spirosoma sp. HMF3257]|uniref:SGNH/GDSL hydrolase family protein n=1 Tax=Spirosoma telluris TaxID=2183553 RepID=A0A327NQZ6_9BACT|nr:hypothetical protein [Spirosoma telluris]RAI76214.1 hypothetical protein HMF3257_22240 [Spirosoma telluris]